MKWLEEIKGKIEEKQIRSLSDADIEFAFKDCVCVIELTRLAKKYRDGCLLNEIKLLQERLTDDNPAQITCNKT